MKIIIRRNNKNVGIIDWVANEDFTNLINTTWEPFTLTAENLFMNINMNCIDKLLLSAIAGAVIQYLIDNKYILTNNAEFDFTIVDDAAEKI